MSRFSQLEDRHWLEHQSRAHTTREIAQMVGCSPATVSRARAKHGIRITRVVAGDEERLAGQATIGRYMSSGGPLRQSLLRSFDECPQQALWSTERHSDTHSDRSALGTAFHMVAAEILNTLRRTGETQMPSQECVEVMYEVISRPQCPHLSDQLQTELRILVIQFAAFTWRPERIISLEDRLRVEVPCPDGQTRVLTGAPDVIIAEPPVSCVVVDYKTGWAVPPEPRDGNWDRDGGRPYLSERGVFQLDTYGYMIMREFPQIQRCTLREAHVRLGQVREAHLDRHELEHVERRLGVLLQRLDEMLDSRKAEARPGSWCSHCPRPSRCPIPAEDRGVGQIESHQHAIRVGEMLAVVEAFRDQARVSLKAWFEENTVEPVPVGDAWIGWRTDAKGRRSFGLHTRPSADRERVVA